MATLTTSFHGLKLSGLPLVNIRLEFNQLLALFRSKHFRNQFAGNKGKPIPIRSHHFTWHGRAEVLLSYLLRDAIVSLESAVSGAVYIEALHSGTLTSNVLETTKNPFSLPERGTASCVFNGLPSLINPSFALMAMDQQLWGKFQSFYREVRNPLFHAYEVAGNDPEPVWQCLELLWLGFQWINNWHPVEKLMAGPIQWNPATIQAVKKIPKLDENRVRQLVPPYELPGGREHLKYLPNDMAHVAIEDIEGMYLPSKDMVDISCEQEDGKKLKLELSSAAAMKLLGFLALAKENRGWELPDRLW